MSENNSLEDKRVDMEIEFDDELLFDLMKMAHEKDITLNQLINDILRNMLEGDVNA